ncbi:MAG: translocation/assembly module TamB domain-containing protein, partial [Dialister micraerophilus]|nr:translocation/assembly module TamB domain-containing protein [Dialister micraerophilus]
LMLLTLHQNPHASAEDTNQNAFFNAGLAMLFNGGVKDFLTDKIGLDMISVTSGLNDYNDSTGIDKNNFYYIKIGKYIFNDFMLTATGGLNNEERSIGFRYDVNSHLGISAWYNNNRDSFVGTDWKFKF